MTQMFLFLLYFSKIVGSYKYIFPLFIYMLAFCPLYNGYITPSSYPLQNTIPFILATGARILLLSSHRKIKSRSVRDLSPSIVLYAVQFLAITLTEFAFLYFVALLAVEYGVRFAVEDRKPFGTFLSENRTRIGADLLILIASLATYLTFRALHPSDYPGNQLDGIFNLPAVLFTSTMRIAGGTIFGGLHIDFSALRPVDYLLWLIASACLFVIFRDGSERLLDIRNIRKGWLIFLVASYITVSATALVVKYQIACSHGGCRYVDSRAAYVFTALFMLWVLGAYVKSAQRRGATMSATTIAIALTVAATPVFVNNATVSNGWRENLRIWERAKLAACEGGDHAAKKNLGTAVDPEKERAIFMPIAPKQYWQAYVHWVRKSGRCAST